MRSYLSAREPRQSLLKKREFDPSSLTEAAREAGEAFLGNPYLTDDPRFAAWNDGFLGDEDLTALEVPTNHKPPSPRLADVRREQ